MILVPPPLHADDRRAIDRTEVLERELRWALADATSAHAWAQRLASARAIAASVRCAGIDAPDELALAVVDGETPPEADTRIVDALAGSRDAMTLVARLAADAELALDASSVRAVHFVALARVDGQAGCWRRGRGYVRGREAIVYEPPAAGDVVPLVDAFAAAANDREVPASVRAALVHLRALLVRPFEDGNGRVARCLHALVEAHASGLAPEIVAIDEDVAARLDHFFDLLRGATDAAGTREWVRACIATQYDRARARLHLVEHASDVWDRCSRTIAGHDLPARVTVAIADATLGRSIRNASYRAAVRAVGGTEISNETASRDLGALVGAGLLEPRGERRGRAYVAGGGLEQLGSTLAAQPPSPTRDPFGP